MNYKQGLQRLRDLVEHRSPELLSDYSLLYFRLNDFLEREARFGQSSNNDFERAQVVDQLIKFTSEHFDLQFLDLCRSDESQSSYPLVQSEAIGAEDSGSLPLNLWEGGCEVPLQGTTYIVHGPVSFIWNSSHSALFQRAKAQHVGTNRFVWLKQIQIHRDDISSAHWRNNLSREARLLDTLESESHAFPHRIALESSSTAVTLAHTYSRGQLWSNVFHLSNQPLETRLIPLLLRSTFSLCDRLKAMHRLHFSHRALTPDTILLADGRNVLLQDVGLAGWKAEPGEGPDLYRAPEQSLSHAQLVLPGPSTDIYQVGLLLYHSLSGHIPPATASLPPLCTWNEHIPPTLDTVLHRALSPRVRERWRTIADFSSALRRVSI